MPSKKKIAEKNFAYYEQLKNKLVEQDQDRDAAYADYEAMYHLEYNLPDVVNALPWVRPVISQDPHDAIAAGKRVLSSVFPKINFQPLTNMKEDKDRANEYEQALKWQLFGVNRRRGMNLIADVVESALLYMAVAAQVIDLDHHIKYMKAEGRDTSLLERARRKGRFVVNLYNPRFVHARKTSMGTEAVLLRTERTAIDVMEEWGDPTGELEALARDNAVVVYNDLMDWTNRVVWIESGGQSLDTSVGGKTVDSGGGMVGNLSIKLMDVTPHGLDFSPWVAVLGESALETQSEHKYHPMLYAIRQSGSWDTINIAQSLTFSDHIAKAAQPSYAEEGPNPQTAEVDYTDPSKPLKVPAANTVKSLQQQQIDPAKAEIIDRLRADMERSTVSSILQGGGQLGANLAFASLNLATQTAVGALKPPKELAESALAEIFTIVMLWAKHTEIPLMGYNSNTSDKEKFGEQIVIDPDLYTEETIFLSVELTPDVPTDRQQRANAASMMIQWGYPVEMALQDVGVDNPGAAIETWYQEKLLENRMQLAMEREKAAFELEIQYEKAMQDIEIEVQRMQALQPQQPPAENTPLEAQPGQGGAGLNAQMLAQLMQGENPGGVGFDANQGGIPTAMANPSGQTAEGQVGGVDAAGNEPMPGGMM